MIRARIPVHQPVGDKAEVERGILFKQQGVDLQGIGSLQGLQPFLFGIVKKTFFGGDTVDAGLAFEPALQAIVLGKAK